MESEMHTTVQNIKDHHTTFVTYVRTKMFLKKRFRDNNKKQLVYMSLSEIEHRFFPLPEFNLNEELNFLMNNGELAVTKDPNKNNSKILLLEALKPGPINLSLIQPKSVLEDDLMVIIKSHLTRVSLPESAPSTSYFDLFLKHKCNYPDLFFRVDDFSGRVHTPVTSFKSEYRSNILLDGHQTCSIDVVTMQPLLLGKILTLTLGENQFSSWIDSGVDIYSKLQSIANLNTRDIAKKRFFEILFAPPNDNLAKIFGEAEWVVWINQYKSKVDPGNPHSKYKTHSNLAWLLQTTEVKLMRKLWHELVLAGITFLSVHDEIIIKTIDLNMALDILNKIFNKEFRYFKFHVKESIPSTRNIDMQLLNKILK